MCWSIGRGTWKRHGRLGHASAWPCPIAMGRDASILLRGAQGDLPFGMQTKQMLSEPSSPSRR